MVKPPCEVVAGVPGSPRSLATLIGTGLHRPCEDSTTSPKALVASTELRPRVAHGVSRGFSGRPSQAPEGRQQTRPSAPFSRPICRRSAARLLRPPNPRLTPLATLCRNSVATPQSVKRHGISTPPVKPGANAVVAEFEPRRHEGHEGELWKVPTSNSLRFVPFVPSWLFPN